MSSERPPSLETTRSGLSPELLRAALTDVAPSTTRARVLQALDSSLREASAHAPDSMRGTGEASCQATAAGSRLTQLPIDAKSDVPCKAPAGPAALSVGIPRASINPARAPLPPARPASLRPSLCPPSSCPPSLCPPPSLGRRFGRFLPALQLAAAVAVGVGSAAGARVFGPGEGGLPYAGAITSPSARANTLTPVDEAPRAKSGEAAASNRNALPRRTPPPAPEPAPSETEQPAEDWLGAQLSILSQADRSLRDGKPEEAMRSLETYAALFPMGLLEPQVTLLRQRAQVVERRQVFIFP